jgi:hypothetical protein
MCGFPGAILSGCSLVASYDYVYKGKVVPVHMSAPRHEDVLGSGGMAPRILNLGTRCR